MIHERDRALREVEELGQKRGQMLSFSVLEYASENFSFSLKIGEGGLDVCTEVSWGT